MDDSLMTISIAIDVLQNRNDLELKVFYPVN